MRAIQWLSDMGKIENTEIRNTILEYLYDALEGNPGGYGIGKSGMLDLLELQENPEIMDFNMLYLEEKGLVKLKFLGSLWAYAKLTALGIDVVEKRRIRKHVGI